MPSSNGQRECPICPQAWTKACVHWGEQTLSLIDRRASAHTCKRAEGERYGVALTEPWEPCNNGCRDVMARVTGEAGFYTDNLPAAEAEFERRNLALLGREVS